MLFREPSKIDVFLMKGLFGSIGRIYFSRYVKSLGFKETDHVIDYGSGTGVASGYIATAVNKGHVTCVDRSERWLEVAKETLKDFSNVDLKQGDIEKLDIPDGAFDAVFVHFVLHDIDEPERTAKVMALTRKLKKGGRTYQGEPTASNHGMRHDEMNRLMSDCGLKKISTYKGRMLMLGKVNYGVYEK
jgi:ubiquinone/menaquinone biosynthesis C-methylase UbiE